MLTTEQIDRLLSQGANVLSGDGEKIGSIGQVFVDNEAGQPSWVTVRTGLFGMSESFVPLEGARLEGNDIVVPYNKNQVKDAPRIDADRPLEPAEEDRLYQHYRMDTGGTYTDADIADASSTTRQDTTGTDRTETRDATDADRAQTRDTTGTAGYDATDADRAQTRDTTGTAGYDAADADRAQTRDATGTAGYDATDADRAQTRDTTGTAGYDATDADRAQTRDATGTAGYGTATSTTDAATPPTTRQDAAGTDRSGTHDATGTAGYGTTAPAADAARAASTPQDTGTDRTETRDTTGRGRLRKYVTTETVTRTVPVQREEVRIEREPITEEDRGEVSNRPDSDDEVILHEERVIVTKETVPVERVRIVTETVADEVTIREKVHKEHLDGEDSDGSDGSEGSEGSDASRA
ncbi:conserved domain-containing protein [Arthrobacter sp. 49Tsu3.1M3]|uniref:PRC and DUF2382 domain-containing protein n=1 Tax=Arthrobacter sp. 49Tsu3.1M3 TaxID=1279029 RepID=UPI0009A69CCC|nr:PRC and DUF2382 domain-containing protein [Arthrobacter sp. 49Tsu3.1M3]SKB35708.1 conserved domain-containing protein [Arthrobacter sp. 49Tsu3.1M3]